MTNPNKLLSSLLFAAGLVGAAGSASAGVITVDFSTGTPASNYQAFGSSLSTGLGNTTGQNAASYVVSAGFNAQIGDVIDGSGTWFNNAANGSASSTLWLGVFNSLTPTSTPLVYTATTCKADNQTSCTTTLADYTATMAGMYYLVYFSNAATRGDGFKTDKPRTTFNQPPTNVPVPASVALLGLGLIGIAAARRKQA
jgi:PEP-CTERM motif